jgi:hypothetical protein
MDVDDRRFWNVDINFACAVVIADGGMAVDVRGVGLARGAVHGCDLLENSCMAIG